MKKRVSYFVENNSKVGKRQQKRRYVHVHHHHFSRALHSPPSLSLSLLPTHSPSPLLSQSHPHTHTFHAFAINAPSSPHLSTPIFLLHCFSPSSEFIQYCWTHISTCRILKLESLRFQLAGSVVRSRLHYQI